VMRIETDDAEVSWTQVAALFATVGWVRGLQTEQLRIHRREAGWCCSDAKRCWDDSPE
jgi:hypothetical protein